MSVVIRVDLGEIAFDETADPPNGLEGITVTQVLPTWEEALAEVARLNESQSGKGCRYTAMTTRMYPDGRASA